MISQLSLRFPVVSRDEDLFLVDGEVLRQAIADKLGPDTLIRFAIVTDQQARDIRQKDLANRAVREPMARARQAYYLQKAGTSHAVIAQRLSIDTLSRVSQMVKAAETEAYFPALRSALARPERISEKFWADVAKAKDYATNQDREQPLTENLSLLHCFNQRVAKVSRMTGLSGSEVRSQLQLPNARDPQKLVRRRMIGKALPVPGTDRTLSVDRTRSGGFVLNLMPGTNAAIGEKIVEFAIKAIQQDCAELKGGARNN